MTWTAIRKKSDAEPEIVKEPDQNQKQTENNRAEQSAPNLPLRLLFIAISPRFIGFEFFLILQLHLIIIAGIFLGINQTKIQKNI